jgi:creatinine amidohydrolase
MGFMDEIFRACKAREVTPEQAGGHSGEFETSLMLSVRYVGDQLGIAALVFEKGFRAATENGVLGDPSDASAANGEAYLAAITDLLVGFIKAHKPK